MAGFARRPRVRAESLYGTDSFRNEYFGEFHTYEEAERHRGGSSNYQRDMQQFGIDARAFQEALVDNPGKLIIGSIFFDRQRNNIRNNLIRGEYFINLGGLTQFEKDCLHAHSNIREGGAVDIVGGGRVEKLKQLRDWVVKESKELEEQYPDDKEMSGCLDDVVDKLDELFQSDLGSDNGREEPRET